MLSRFEDERCPCAPDCWCRRPVLWRLRYKLPYGHRIRGRFEMWEPDDPWGGRQPKYEKLVRRHPQRFELVTTLPSGERIAVPLGRFAGRSGDPSAPPPI
jgi:hypothetical protein